MKRIHAKIVFSMLFITLLSNVVTTHAAAPPVGVKDGDSFDFIVEKFQIIDNLNPIDTYEGYYIGEDEETYDSAYARQGEEFTITIVDATPFQPYTDDEKYQIVIDIEVGGETFTDEISLSSLDLVSSIDWDIQKADLEKEIDEFNQMLESVENSSGTVELIDSNTEFGVKASWTENYEFSNTETIEIRIEKSTGVMLYYKEKETGSFYVEENGEQVFHEYSSEVIVKRKGYSPPGEEDDDILAQLPGLEITTILSAFAIMFIPMILKRRK